MMTKFVNRLSEPPEAARTRQAQGTDPTVLTRRERQTLAWLARGVSNKEIARALNLAESTVKVHVQSICESSIFHPVCRPRSMRSSTR